MKELIHLFSQLDPPSYVILFLDFIGFVTWICLVSKESSGNQDLI